MFPRRQAAFYGLGALQFPSEAMGAGGHLCHRCPPEPDGDRVIVVFSLECKFQPGFPAGSPADYDSARCQR